MSEWLDLELSHHLAPVTAPDALWDRVLSRAGREACPTRRAWPIAAILTLAAAAGTLWLVAKGAEPALDLRQLAIEQLLHPEPLALHTDDPRLISAWMRQAGLEVAFPSTRSGAVQLVSAGILEKRGARIGAVAYRVGTDTTATLLVARARNGADTGHGLLFWRTRGQSYALACSNPDRPEAACLLCHI